MNNTLSPRIRVRARALHHIDPQIQISTVSRIDNFKATDLQPASEVERKRFEKLFDGEAEVQPAWVVWKKWTVVIFLLMFSVASVVIVLTNALHVLLSVDMQPPMKTTQKSYDLTIERTTNISLENFTQGDLAFGLRGDRTAAKRSSPPTENRDIPPRLRPLGKEGKRPLRRYPTIDRSILEKFGGLDPDGVAGDREIDVPGVVPPAESHTKSRDTTRRWPTILHIPEGRTSQKATRKSTVQLQPGDPPVICGPNHPSGRACRFLFPLRMAEQESKARIHFTQVAQLAGRLGRILVLPNVGKSRMGACYKYPFDTYYDTASLFAESKQAEPELKDPGYVTLDDFRLWSESAAEGGKKRLASSLLSVAGSVPQVILDSAQKSLDDVELAIHRYPTEIAHETEFPGCFPSKWTQLALEETSMFIALEDQQHSTLPTLDLGELVASRLNSMDAAARSVLKVDSEGQEVLQVAAVSEPEPDILIVNWELRRPVFSPSSSDVILNYSPELQDLATMLAPAGPYLAIHWRMETVETDVLEDCAHALVDAISDILHDTGHLGSGIQQVWFASDYPYAISSPDDTSEPGKLAKSGTFKTFGKQHQAAVEILTRAFEDGGELDRWELVDISGSIQTHENAGLAKGELLKDTGVLGILDKLIVTKADLFVGGSKRCSRQSSFTRQVIESRQKSWKELRNVVTAF